MKTGTKLPKCQGFGAGLLVWNGTVWKHEMANQYSGHVTGNDNFFYIGQLSLYCLVVELRQECFVPRRRKKNKKIMKCQFFFLVGHDFSASEDLVDQTI